MTRPIQLVLDASAVAAYPSVHVAEPISEVFHDEDAAVGVPVAALAQAGAAVKNYARIRELLAEPGVTVLDLQAGQWEQVASALGVVRGDMAAAAALIAAYDADCEILTGAPDLYEGLGDDPPIITLG
jgi:hypothetical protein